MVQTKYMYLGKYSWKPYYMYIIYIKQYYIISTYKPYTYFLLLLIVAASD